MKQTNGPVLPLAPTQGDSFWRSDSTVHFCFTDGVWSPIGGGGGSESRIYYDTASAGYGHYPYTTGHFNSTNASTAPRLCNNWNQFAKCSFLVENYTTHVDSVHSFPTMQDYINWKNANIPHGGMPDHFLEQVNLKPFDVVDSSIPTVSRLYGMNNIYFSAKGGKSKASFPNHMGQGGNSTLMQTMYDVWAHWWPGLAGIFTIADFATGASGRHACWTSKNFTKMYAMPKVGEIVRINASPDGSAFRQSANENWEGFNNINQSDGWLTIISRLFVLVDENGNNAQLLSEAKGEGAKNINRHLLEGGDNTAFTVFQLAGPGAVGDRQIATLWKPMGIDRLWLPYFDDTRYSMEAVYLNDFDTQSDWFKTMTNFNAGSGSSPHPNSGCFLKKSSWIPLSTRYLANLRHVGTTNRFRIHFRLRDLITGKIGKLSPAHVEIRVGETNAPVKIIVKQESRND